MLRYYSISLGCPKNRVDTERTLGRLASAGAMRGVASPREADLVFINTCAFIAPAVRESVRVVLECMEEIRELPEEERPLLVIAGCLIGRYGAQTLAPDLPEADLLLGASSPHPGTGLEHWPEAIRAALAGKGKLPAEPDRGGRLLSTGPAYAWLKVSEGCRHACAFCTIPSIRGILRSEPAFALLDEARALLAGGVRELALVAQDLTAWGRDSKTDRGLMDLLERLLPLPGLARLRLMYLYPAGISRELLTFLQRAGPPFVPYFDVPLQHAASSVLSRMGRPFAGNPRQVVERIREFFPEAALRTTFITGFPGEREEDFAELAGFVEETRFHHVGVFAYHAEQGTRAAVMPDQVPERVREERRDALMAMQRDISGEIMESHVGQRMEVLVDAPHADWPGLHVGRVWFQAPEVDGVTYVSGPGVVPGALVEADIMEGKDYDLVALTDAGPE